MERLKNKLNIVALILLAIVVILGMSLYNKNTAYANIVENDNDKALYEVVDRVQNVKIYLAKVMISKESVHGAKTLTWVWREANLAMSYLGMLPIESQKIENTEKFLNQVGEYAYSLSIKCIEGQNLTDEEITKIQELYNYANDLSNTLNEMLEELNNKSLTWKDLQQNIEKSEVSSINNFDVVEQNFHEYMGLIYDGAFSEHIVSSEKKGLTGEDITEDKAKKIAEEFIGKEKVVETKNNGNVENGNINVYRFEIKNNNNETIGISISKKGGHVVYMNLNRNINEDSISEQEAVKIGKDYLKNKGFENMQETYYIKNEGFIIVNYAYIQNNVTMYADLIKVKIALDNGEVIGIDTTGYLNNHHIREISSELITSQKARSKITDKTEITSEKLAMIPTEFNTEILCYEFKGKINECEFIAYINAKTGEEEDILIVINTENGVLTE